MTYLAILGIVWLATYLLQRLAWLCGMIWLTLFGRRVPVNPPPPGETKTVLVMPARTELIGRKSA
jgi:hypothetical protein